MVTRDNVLDEFIKDNAGNSLETSNDLDNVNDTELDEAEDISNEDAASSEVEDELDEDLEDDFESDEEEDEEDGEEEEESDDEEDSSDWDDSEEVEEEEQRSEPLDFAEFAQDLGDDSIKDKTSLKTYISQLKTKLVDTEAKAKKADAIDGLPSELQDAVSLALSGGDYLDYLNVNSVDYTKVSPVDLFVDDVVNNFTDSNGVVDEDQVNEYLDQVTDAEKLYRGKQLQRQLVGLQQSESNRLKTIAQNKKSEKLKEIKQTVNGLDEISDLKLQPKHKEALVSAMSKGSIEKALLGENYTTKQLAELVFKAKYFDTIAKKMKQGTRSSTKRDMVNSLTNSSVSKSKRQAGTTTKTPSGADMYLNSLLGK